MSDDANLGPSPQTTATFERYTDSPNYSTASHQEIVDALPAGSALLIVQAGPNSGARFLLDAEKVSAGRDPSSDIFLDDATVSRKHALFRAEPSGFSVRDVGSLNGTYVSRERVEEHQLRAGDEVQIGKYRLTYHPSPQGVEHPYLPDSSESTPEHPAG